MNPAEIESTGKCGQDQRALVDVARELVPALLGPAGIELPVRLLDHVLDRVTRVIAVDEPPLPDAIKERHAIRKGMFLANESLGVDLLHFVARQSFRESDLGWNGRCKHRED
jgi:hypothetical protein